MYRRKKPTLVQILSSSHKDSRKQTQKTSLRGFMTKLVSKVSKIEDRFHHFVQTKIDPLFGKTRHVQMQEIITEEGIVLSRNEKIANRRIVLGALTSGVALVSYTVYPPLTWLALLLGAGMASSFYHFAYLELQRTKRLGAIHLTCIYLPALWLSGYAAFGALNMLIFAIALKIKAFTERQSRNNFIDIFQFQTQTVWIRNHQTGDEIEIPFDQLQAGDTIVLYAGQIVPVDGSIRAGMASVDQHMLTGESQPVEKGLGDSVMASTVVISGKIDVWVEKTGKETSAGQIGKILNQAAQHNTAISVRAIELADRFALPTLVLSAFSWPFIGPLSAIRLMGSNYTRNTYMSAPLAVLNFLNIAATRGILVKDGSALEQIQTVDTIVFDKTGTLTLEIPHVAQVHTVADFSEEAVMRMAAAAEVRQTHPIALAILAEARKRQLEPPPIHQAHYEVGYGIKVWVDEVLFMQKQLPTGNDTLSTTSRQNIIDTESVQSVKSSVLIRVGSARFMTLEGIAQTDRVRALVEKSKAEGNSLVMVAVDEQLVGCIELQPTARPEAQQIVEGLRKRGLDLYIISGDQDPPTRKLAHDLGMTGYFANTLPEAKADIVEQLQQEGRHICFIGDGINDAIAMRQAQVSISLSGATTIATDTAHIILMEGNLSQLLYLFQIAQKFDTNLKRNIQFTASASLISTVGILLFNFTFITTELFYSLSMAGAIGIAMKPLLDRQRYMESN